MRKIPFAGIELTAQRVRGLRGTSELPGRENVMFGQDFGILVYALLCGGGTKFKLPKAGNGNVFFANKRVRFARADKDVALQYHNQ